MKKLTRSQNSHRKKRYYYFFILIILMLGLFLLMNIIKHSQTIEQHAASGLWQPAIGTSFQWQLSTPVDQTVDAEIYDVDGFDNDASVVSSLHAKGVKVVCYIDVGTYENWRSDQASFPSSVKGSSVDGWPGEQWLDIRQISILGPIMQSRFQMCKDKGFDAIEPDNIDGYSNSTGFPLTAQNQITYNEYIASLAHSLGLSIALKNDVDQISTLEPFFDFALNEQCFEYSECSGYSKFINDNKAVFEVEYNLNTSQFCPQAVAMHFTAMKKDLDLTAYREACPLSPLSGTPNPTSTSAPTSNPTITPTPRPSSTPTPTLTPTTKPTTTPVPSLTSTPVPGSTTLSFPTILLHGIGSAGDSVNPNSGGNTNPLTPSRSLTVQVYNASNVLVTTQTGTITYSTNTGAFSGNVSLGSTVPTGSYLVKVKTDKYLVRQLPGIISLSQGQSTTAPTVSLIVGDINGDNSLNILDYNILLGCYSDFTPPTNCPGTNGKESDLNDDGSVNAGDYNLFLRELSVQSGG